MADRVGRLALQRIIEQDSRNIIPHLTREIGQRSELQQSLLNRRFAASPGFGSTAFGDSLVARRMRNQQDAIAEVLGNVEVSDRSRQLQAALGLGQIEEAELNRKAEERGGLFGSLGSIAGTLGTAAILASSKDRKTDIHEADTAKLLQSIKKAKVKKYRFVPGDEEDDGLLHTGVIAEEAPEEIQVSGGKEINISDSIGLMMGAIQELATRVEDMQKSISANKTKGK